jgi:mannitol 2-dehydrogenase
MTEKMQISAVPSLSNKTVSKLPSDFKIPIYDRNNLTAGIVHIGLGNFHRAHQAWYLHRLMQKGQAHDWAIIGAGVKEFDKGQRLKLLAQDFLTTLIELSPVGRTVEVVGSMIDYVPIEADNGPLIAQMAKPEIKIVTLTVTEGGYYIDPVSKSFDSSQRHQKPPLGPWSPLCDCGVTAGWDLLPAKAATICRVMEQPCVR